MSTQLALFGPQDIHIAYLARCALCRVSLAVAGAWDRFDGCHQCPGLVTPAPPWAVLPERSEEETQSLVAAELEAA